TGGAAWGAMPHGAAVAAAAAGAAWLVGRGATWYTRGRSGGGAPRFAAAPGAGASPAVTPHGSAAEDALVRRIEHQSQVAAEVELAAVMQQAFIPDGRPRGLGPVELAGSFIPASQCGGDWWAALELPEGAGTLVLVADVTGHGIGAARITAAARGAYDAALRLGGGATDLEGLMAAMDAAVRRVGAGHYHMTCFAALIDPERRVRFTSAGHVAPYVARLVDDGRVQIDALVARGNPLGIGTGQSAAAVIEQSLRPGDLVIFYSDGLIDCVSPTGDRLGDRRMQRLLRDIVTADLDIGSVRDRIEHAVQEFAGGTQQPDDITFVAVRAR
ncbi:MAG TPA: PP2C family protein-serine/threonine phosphatase, partial [Kofleriaceae bacterium]|nr:PP2C family protein-serine/threonine phosphatase [Kofleriaceae bacterium]